MSTRGILFRPALALACHEDRKTQTRRLSGRFAVGDVLVVKETHWRWGVWRRSGKLTKKRQDPAWEFVSDEDGSLVKFAKPSNEETDHSRLGWHKRPSLLLPFSLARTRLEVTAVREETVQSASVADIAAEGITPEMVSVMLLPLAAREQTEPCHWFSGAYADASEDWCPTCADEKSKDLCAANPTVDPLELSPDGGWDTEHDSQPFCEGCGVRLEGSLTAYGIESEIEHFNGSLKGSIGSGVAYDVQRILNNTKVRPDNAEEIAHIVWWAAWTLINGAESWERNDVVKVVTFKRQQSKGT